MVVSIIILASIIPLLVLFIAKTVKILIASLSGGATLAFIALSNQPSASWIWSRLAIFSGMVTLGMIWHLVNQVRFSERITHYRSEGQIIHDSLTSRNPTMGKSEVDNWTQKVSRDVRKYAGKGEAFRFLDDNGTRNLTDAMNSEMVSASIAHKNSLENHLLARIIGLRIEHLKELQAKL